MAAPSSKADSIDVTTDVDAGGDITAASGTVTGDVVDATTTMTVAGADVGASLPTTDEKAALVGTGTPAAGDPYVNDSDARMTDARTPTAHAASHAAGAADDIDLAGLQYTIRQILQSDLAAPVASAGSAAWQTVHTFNIANAANENVLVLATLDVRSLAGIAGMASFRITIGGAGGASGQQIDVDMLGVGVQDSKNVVVLLSLGPLAADAARAVTLEILDTAGLTYTVNHAHVIVVRQQG